jgi:hypothetical protein
LFLCEIYHKLTQKTAFEYHAPKTRRNFDD